MRQKFLNLTKVFFVIAGYCYGQMDTTWVRIYGGSGGEGTGTTIPSNMGTPGAHLAYTPNAIYAAISANSNDGFFPQNNGSDDIWVIRINLQGDTLWRRHFGGSDFERVYKVSAAPDQGCIIVGQTQSNDLDFPSSKGSADGFIIRLDSSGNVLWKKRYGGSDADYLYDAIFASNGDIMAVGESISSDGDLFNTPNGFAWALRINPSNGNVIWSKIFPGPDSNSIDFLENFFRITELKDGSGFILAGFTSPNFNDPASDDIYYRKIDGNGNSLWSRKIGSATGGDAIGSIVSSENGKFYLVGRLAGTGSVVSNYYGGNADMWVIYCDSSGNHLWNKNIGGSDWEFAFDAQQDNQNNLYLAGFTRSTNYDANPMIVYGGLDAWIVKLDTSANILWNYRFGGSQNDIILGIQVPQPNQIFVLGRTFSNNIYFTHNYGSTDIFVARIDTQQTTASAALPSHLQNLRYSFDGQSLNLSIQADEVVQSLCLYQITGQKILDIRPNTPNVSFIVPQKGFYILAIRTNANVYYKKLALF